ncbi:MAG: CopD family protein, partial [Dehalococcoidia bacterium]|nr:CopD family protein [Dehalococcoidia bacterium]
QVGFLPDYADSALRWFGLVAAVALVGGLIFLAFVSRPAAEFLDDEHLRRVHDTSSVVVAATALPAAVIVALSTLGQLVLLAGRLGGLADIDNILFDTRSGQLWLARVGLSIALALSVLPMMRSDEFRRSRQASLLVWPLFVGALGLLMTYSLASHAAAQGGAFWGVASDFGHFLATAAWLGALPQLALLFWWTQRRLDEPQRLLYWANALDRFSWLAVVGVALLIATGVFNGFVQLPRLPALWDTTYGRVLIAKLALILPLLGVAGLNAVLLKPRLVAAIDELHAEDLNERPTGSERTRLETALRRLQSALPRTTAAEFLLGVAVLASVGVLAQSTTADGELRQEATAPAGEFAASEQENDLDVELLIEPFGITVNTFTVTLTP